VDKVNTTVSSDQARIVEGIAREAGNLALYHFKKLATLPVEKKGHLDLVTEADKQVEALIIERLRQAFPDDGVFGEEGGEITGTSGRIWVIDRAFREPASRLRRYFRSCTRPSVNRWSRHRTAAQWKASRSPASARHVSRIDRFQHSSIGLDG